MICSAQSEKRALWGCGRGSSGVGLDEVQHSSSSRQAGRRLPMTQANTEVFG